MKQPFAYIRVHLRTNKNLCVLCVLCGKNKSIKKPAQGGLSDEYCQQALGFFSGVLHLDIQFAVVHADFDVAALG